MPVRRMSEERFRQIFGGGLIIPMKRPPWRLKECGEELFDRLLIQLQNDKESELTGPFTHSASKGDLLSGPYWEQIWMIDRKIWLKREWTPVTGWHYYRAAAMDVQ